ncbi:MAG: DUF2148 domain-containing protein [Coriobacteriales bacterium]|jgi:uncharacterized ferredoxin-like protein|nr:DUF2148 domain-containing protein [Coriobacteriales bacterium]
MRIESREAEFEALLELAKSICVAARTAPKACGVDNTDTVILTGDEKAELSTMQRQIGQELGERGKFFCRDADNVDKAQVVVLFGITRKTRGLGELCQTCGFMNCKENEAAGATCVFASMDLGIALGSAASVAANGRADNRIFFSAGKAAERLGLLGKHSLVMGMPLYAGGKNPFFDRG